MIDNSLIWRGAFSVSENVAAPQVIKNGDPDNRGAGMNRGAAFEAHILEIAGAKQRTTETPVQNGRQLSYPQDRDNQQTTSGGQSGEPLNTSRTPGTTFALRSDEGIVDSSSIGELYGNAGRAVAGNAVSSLGSQYQAELSGNGSSMEAAGDDGSRSGRMESAGANADPVAKSDIVQAHGRALSNDDSGGSNVRSQGTSATGPGRGQVAPATFRRAGKSDSSTIPAGHRAEVNAACDLLAAVSARRRRGAKSENAGTRNSLARQTIGLLREANRARGLRDCSRRHLFGRAARRSLRSSSLRGWATLQRRTMGNRFGRIGPQHPGRARRRIRRKCRPRAPIFGRGRSSWNRCRGSALHR